MYDYITGELAHKGENSIVVENNGIGYLINTNNRTIGLLPDIGTKIKIYTKLIHKEDSMLLAGFKHKEDRVIFDTLTSVSGIGTKVAFLLLDEFSGTELIDYVINEDAKAISKAKGVGPKLAQKIVLELKGKLKSPKGATKILTGKIENSNVSAEAISDAQSILQSLGYNQAEYTKAIEFAINHAKAVSGEDILKEALSMLSNV